MKTDSAIKEAVKDINGGVGFGIFAIILTIVIVGIALYTDSDIPGLNVLAFIDVLIAGVCLYFMYNKKSRIASTVFALYFLAGKIQLLILAAETGRTPSTTALLGSLLFGYMYFKAMIGTYTYHKLVNLPPDENTLQT